MAKILLVEDDNNLREIYEARLQAEGYDIVSAMDGEEALVIAKKEKPDLVIADVMMPRISGFEMLDILRNTEGFKEVKVIMLTALGQAEDKTRADSLGADRYLVKSQVTLEDIVKAAQELLVEAGAASPAEAAAPVPVPAPAPVPEPTPVVATPTAIPAPIAAPTTDVAPIVQPAAAPAPAPMSTPVPAPEPIAQPTPMPEPAMPTPAVPIPAVPEPPTMPQPEPPTAPAPPVAPEPMPIEPPQETVNAQTVSDEEDAIKAQIESFVSQNSQTAPGVTPTEPAQTEDNTPKPVETPAQTTDTVMADAINDLVSSANESNASENTSAAIKAYGNATMPAPSVINPAPQEAAAPTPQDDQTDSNDDSATVSHKKIIQPIVGPTSSQQPDLNELLAKEGMGLSENDHTISQHDGMPSAPHPPGHVISPNTGQDNIDPSSISL